MIVNSPALRAARSGLSGRRVQAVVISLVVLAATAACTLALGLLVDSNAPFDHAFTAQQGAHVTATVSASAAAATAKPSGVIAQAGPFAVTTNAVTITVTGGPGGGPQGVMMTQLTIAGRGSPGGPVDDLTVTSGHWPTSPDQIVLGRDRQGPAPLLGATLTVNGAPGSPRLTVVGLAVSVTGTAQAWVLPAELATLRAPHTPATDQLLYRFARAGTAAEVTADIARIRAALPRGALLGAESYLTAKLNATRSIAPWVPFIVAFGLIGLVMSVLIVANVVSGAVTAGTRRIGVLKSIGFSPGQVVAAYLIEVGTPALGGCVAGVVVGNLLSVPLLGQTAQVYGVGALAVPLWVDLAVPLAMLALTGAAALPPAVRAARLSAVRAIATGRAPRPSGGYAAHRLLGRAPVARRLPRPVTLGLASPFGRPGRTLVTLAAIGFGVVAVTFAAGLATSLDRVAADLSRSSAVPVQVEVPGAQVPGGPSTPGPAAQQRVVVAALHAEPGTGRYVAEADDDLSVPGLAGRLRLAGFGGDARWTGYALVTGHWFASGTDQVVVNTAFLTATGTMVGDSYPLTSANGQLTVRIAGEIFDPAGGSPELLGGLPALSRLDPGLTVTQYDVALKPGIDATAYASALGRTLGLNDQVNATSGSSPQLLAVLGLVGALMLLLAAVAGLGVLNTVVLQIRERVHDLGVFKAVGMTPRQTMAMVICSVAGTGLVAGLIAIPAGIALHHGVLPVMGHAAQTALPASVLDVYRVWEIVLLALAGLVIAVAGALAPAGWAARTSTAFALRAE
ncbi:MAG: FtsX-like permease family protein [Streptosporangiaceae bacterium]|jgi:putative ABC transport system permease protein